MISHNYFKFSSIELCPTISRAEVRSGGELPTRGKTNPFKFARFPIHLSLSIKRQLQVYIRVLCSFKCSFQVFPYNDAGC